MSCAVTLTDPGSTITHVSAEMAKPKRWRGTEYDICKRSIVRSTGSMFSADIAPLLSVQKVTSTEAVADQSAICNQKAKPPRKRNKKPRSVPQAVPLASLKWLTIAQTALRYPAFSEKALRHLVAQAEAYKRYPDANLRSSGFIECVVRPEGKRKIVIDAEKFESWLQSCSVATK